MSTDNHIPPQALDAEKAILGGVLLDNRSVHDLPAKLKAEAFYMPSHGHIFEAMLTLWQREAPIDVISVSDLLKTAGHDVAAGQLLDLSEFGMLQSIGYHANLVLETWRQRRAIALVRENLLALQESPNRHAEIITRLCDALTAEDSSDAASYDLRAVMVESLKRLEKSQDNALLIPTGFNALDERIGGIERGELAIVGGRPSMGKTSVATDIALNAAEKGYRVLFVSVETSREKLGIRMLSRETKINSRKLRTVMLADAERKRLIDASGKLSGLPIRVMDRDPDWNNIKREIQRRKRDGLDLVLLDYLTLLDLPTGKYERRDVAVGRIANEAKRLALSLNIAFVLLSQLNRKTEDRGEPEPSMSDLRDSGEIEQAADLIIFPFRPVVYNPDYQPADKAFLKVAKARDLPTGNILVRFNKEITSFSDWSEF
jgi:replicative DNA helicase